MKLRYLFPVFFACLLIALSCKDNATSSEPPNQPENPDLVSEDIGPNGGEIISKDGKLTLTIPAGALGNTETITIEPINPDELGPEFDGIKNELGIEMAYELGPDGLEFDQPVTASVPSGQNPVLNDSTLQLSLGLMLTSSGGQLELLDSLRVEPAGGSGDLQFSGELSHFSTFSVTGTDTTRHLTATISGIPEKLEVNEEVVLNARAEVSFLNVQEVKLVPFTRRSDPEDVFIPANSVLTVPLSEVFSETVGRTFEGTVTYVCNKTGENPPRASIKVTLSEDQPDAFSDILNFTVVLQIPLIFLEMMLQLRPSNACIRIQPQLLTKSRAT